MGVELGGEAIEKTPVKRERRTCGRHAQRALMVSAVTQGARER
jgi:hypothetical protein